MLNMTAEALKEALSAPFDNADIEWRVGATSKDKTRGLAVPYVTNRALEEAGIRLHTIPSAELSRGRGGPRCMSMPLWREDP